MDSFIIKKIKSFNGSIVSDGQFTIVDFSSEDSAADFVQWLDSQYYQVLSFIAPHDNYKFYQVTYR